MNPTPTKTTLDDALNAIEALLGELLYVHNTGDVDDSRRNGYPIIQQAQDVLVQNGREPVRYDEGDRA